MYDRSKSEPKKTFEKTCILFIDNQKDDVVKYDEIKNVRITSFFDNSMIEIVDEVVITRIFILQPITSFLTKKDLIFFLFFECFLWIKIARSHMLILKRARVLQLRSRRVKRQ